MSTLHDECPVGFNVRKSRHKKVGHIATSLAIENSGPYV